MACVSVQDLILVVTFLWTIKENNGFAHICLSVWILYAMSKNLMTKHTFCFNSANLVDIVLKFSVELSTFLNSYFEHNTCFSFTLDIDNS